MNNKVLVRLENPWADFISGLKKAIYVDAETGEVVEKYDENKRPTKNDGVDTVVLRGVK